MYYAKGLRATNKKNSGLRKRLVFMVDDDTHNEALSSKCGFNPAYILTTSLLLYHIESTEDGSLADRYRNESGFFLFFAVKD